MLGRALCAPLHSARFPSQHGRRDNSSFAFRHFIRCLREDGDAIDDHFHFSIFRCCCRHTLPLLYGAGCKFSINTASSIEGMGLMGGARGEQASRDAMLSRYFAELFRLR